MTDYIHDAIKSGLSAKAAAVYVALLEAGNPLPPKAIVTRTRLHRQYVYDALRELRDKRLAITVGEGHRIKYGAGSPDRLLQEAEKSRLEAFDGVSALMKLYDRSPAGVVEIVRGSTANVEGDLQLLQEAKRGDFLDIIGGAGMEWVKLFKGREEEWERLRKEKGVVVRYIGSAEDVHYNRTQSPIEHESRCISGIGNLVNVAIRPDTVSFNIYEPEVLTVRVRNAGAVASQRALFEVLWAAAK